MMNDFIENLRIENIAPPPDSEIFFGLEYSVTNGVYLTKIHFFKNQFYISDELKILLDCSLDSVVKVFLDTYPDIKESRIIFNNRPDLAYYLKRYLGFKKAESSNKSIFDIRKRSLSVSPSCVDTVKELLNFKWRYIIGSDNQSFTICQGDYNYIQCVSSILSFK